MTSDTSECFVYITLPGQTKAVTAGKFRQTKDRHDTSVGEFVYGKSYMANPERVEFDPVELKLRVRPYSTARLGGTFGALRDASPDFWGRKLIEKRLGVTVLPEIQYMLNSPDDRAGALGFGLGATPPAPIRLFNRTLDLGTLMALADQIIAAENDPHAPKPAGPDAEQAELLVRAGTSMGGARPKATVEEGDALWLAKFSRADDRWNNPRAEHAVMTLARECGIATAVTRLTTIGDRDVILVKRFDREKAEHGWLRTRMVSGLTLLNADEDERAKWSYLLLADELRRCAAQDQGKELAELYRRICFNALVTNLDDHPRNHAVLAGGRGWTLSPAYDLTPTPVIATERNLAMSFGDRGRLVNRSNLLSRCDRFLLTHEEAERILDTMAATVRLAWYGIARSAGLSQQDCELIRSAFPRNGFEDVFLP
jgi:serine/threonine-protein kinase HipA